MRRTKRIRGALALIGLIWLAGSLPGQATEVVADDVAPASGVEDETGPSGTADLAIKAEGEVVSAQQASGPGQAVPTAEGTPKVETYQGIPVGFTEEGYPFIGDPNASVILEEYSDYLCPFCGRYFNQTFP